MLTSLQIRDYAIIDSAAVDFGPGLTVFSGETGAGKSILFDALGLILGDRADSSCVRTGSARADLTATFSLHDDSPALSWLREHDLQDPDAPGDLVLRRTVSASGQSKAFINGQPSPLAPVRTLADLLLNIHGQHEHQTLLKPKAQRDLLDGYGQLQAQHQAVREAHSQLQSIRTRIDELNAVAEDGSQRSALLAYQLGELQALDPQDAEFEELDAEFRRLSKRDALARHASTAQQQLYEDEQSVYSVLSAVLGALREASAIDPSFEAAAELVDKAQIDIKEAAQMVGDAMAAIDMDPERQAELQRRIDQFHELARKHRIAPAELAAHTRELERQLEDWQAADATLERLQAEQAEAESAYDQAARALSEARRQAAKRLGAALTETVRPLGLPHATAQVDVTTDEDTVAASGRDRVDIAVTMNPGQSPASLAKVASGGELARLSLALQVVCIDQSPVPVLLFDEVDVGISGAIAEVVGRQLKALGAQYQVLCVTHQPQVAALSDTHYAVSKHVRDGATHTQVDTLDAKGRTAELARMLGGVDITERTLAHAEDMLERSR